MVTKTTSWIPNDWETNLVKNGNSLAVNIPAFIVKQMEAKKGDTVKCRIQFKIKYWTADDEEIYGLISKKLFLKYKPEIDKLNLDYDYSEFITTYLYVKMCKEAGIQLKDALNKDMKAKLIEQKNYDIITQIAKIIDK